MVTLNDKTLGLSLFVAGPVGGHSRASASGANSAAGGINAYRIKDYMRVPAEKPAQGLVFSGGSGGKSCVEVK